MEQGDNRLVRRVEATETSVPQYAVRSKRILMMTGWPRNAGGQIVQGGRRSARRIFSLFDAVAAYPGPLLKRAVDQQRPTAVTIVR